MRLGVAAALVGRRLVRGDVAVEDGVITGVGLAGPGTGIAAPGFVDLHVNGFAGVDLQRPGADWDHVCAALAATGVVAFRPAFITGTEPVDVPDRREILGVHLEGPFLAPGRLGVHPPAARRDPDPDWLPPPGVAQVTLAPELPGALDLVERLVAHGVLVSVGHTDAIATEAHAAFDRGARSATHLFNAMRPPTAREPGPAFAALAREDVVVQLIADRVHVADDTLRVAFAAAPGRVALVTDASAAAGAPDGAYTLGPIAIRREGAAVRDAEGRLAGSALTMDAAVRNAVAVGQPVEEALLAASAVPARLAGRPDLGALGVGSRGGIVVLDDRLEVRESVQPAA